MKDFQLLGTYNSSWSRVTANNPDAFLLLPSTVCRGLCSELETPRAQGKQKANYTKVAV